MNKLEELEKKYKELGEEIERLKSQSGERWRGEYMEDYYLIDDSGEILCDDDEGTNIDDFRFNTRNYFKTEEEAEKVLNKTLIYNKLKDLALKLNNGTPVDWSNGSQQKFYIYYDNQTNRLDYGFHSTYKDIGAIYSLDPEFLEVAIDEIGEEDLLKLFEE